jgi:hypothetical protein
MNCCDEEITPSKVPMNIGAVMGLVATNPPDTETDPVN